LQHPGAALARCIAVRAAIDPARARYTAALAIG
jgi:hypothetical protein